MPFYAETVSLEIVRSMGKVAKTIRKHDADLARQLRRSVNSIALNVSEGERRTGRDQLHLYTIAAGSAKEAQRCLINAEAWGYVTAEDTAEPHRHLDRELGLLWGLTHPKNE